MQVKTLKDVLHWSSEFHRLLSNCLQHCTERDENERARMLLDYLSTHESHLHTVLQQFEETRSINALSTWSDEYLDKHPLLHYQHCDKPFEGLTTLEIMAVVMEQHKQIIELYRHLHERADNTEIRDLLGQLVALEEHEAVSMAQGANRLEDY